jgi:hypothetical protein
MGKIPWWVWALGLGGVGYLLYKSFSGVTAAMTTATAPVASTIADIWLSLPFVGLPANMQVLGNVTLPTGTQIPMNSLVGKIRQDANGNVYANVSGSIYQLSPSDSQGNYPATLIGAAPAGG